jgi:hypothetical protein
LPTYYKNKKNMDGISTNEKHVNSNQLSEENWKKLQQYYAENSGSLLEQCLHLSEITGHKGTYKDAHLQNLNNLTPPQETT